MDWLKRKIFGENIRQDAQKSDDAEYLAQLHRDFETMARQRDEFMSQRDDLISQRDNLISQRDDLISQRDDLISQKVELASQRDKFLPLMAELTAQRDRLLKDLRETSSRYDDVANAAAATSKAAVERDRLALELARSGVVRTQAEQSIESVRASYLDLVERVVTGVIYDDPALAVFSEDAVFDAQKRSRGLDWPQRAFSMVGAARIHNFRALIELTIAAGTPGDIVETGVWRGGASILARAALSAYGVRDRRVFVADSFEGLPPPDITQYPADEGSTFHQYQELAVSLEQVKQNFAKFGLLDEQVVFVKGWFKDTMPDFPCRDIAVLRLDGDMYESTIVVLRHLFDRVRPGGWIIIDDYDWVPACKRAVTDFLSERGVTAEIIPIDGVGAYFQKTL